MFVYDSIASLRVVEDMKIRIIGVDVNPEAQGKFLVDEFETIPTPEANERNYIDSLISICKRHSVDAIILTSDTESRAVANHRDLFISKNIAVSVSSPDIVATMTDKLTLLQKLENAGVDVGNYFPVESVESAQSALKELGYPNRRVVIKPRSGTGSRGVLIADSSIQKYTNLVKDRFCGAANFEVLCQTLTAQNANFQNCIALPYYGEIAYDVDCVAKLGKAINVVPRQRQYQNPLSPFVEACVLDLNKDIINYVTEITKILEVHGACDYDIAIDYDAKIRVMDASCRPSGSCGATHVAGVNILQQILRVILGCPTKDYSPQDGTSLRFYPRLAPVSLLS